MQDRNPVHEALAKPQFKAIQVGGAIYREIHIPESVRTYTDTAHWDQKHASSARRGGEVEEMRGTKESEVDDVDACAFTGSENTGEETPNDDKERGRAPRERRQEGLDVTRSVNPDERECGVGASANAGTGDKDPLDSVGAPFCVEEGPFHDAPGRMWVLILRVKTPLYHVVVGRKKGVLQRIQKQYGVHATAHYDVPSFQIRLKAANWTALLRARKHMRDCVEEKKETIPYTHFISLPLTDPRFQARYCNFKTQVTAAYPSFGEALFAVPQNMHVTILLLRLLTDEEEARCKGILESISGDIYDAVDTRSLVLHLKGLQIMNDDPSAASVLFTSQYTGNEKDRETDRRLRRLCAVVAEAFRVGGFLSENEINLQGLDTGPGEDTKQKLHATILNAKFLQAQNVPRRATADNPEPATRSPSASKNDFDATELLSNFKLFDFFECRVPSVDLVARARYTAEGNAGVAASVRLP